MEAIYGITIKTRALEEGGTGEPSASELLRAYARARGFQTQGLGQPDESRAARYILKDYVAGKLLYVAPPPGIEDDLAFNNELYSEEYLPEKRRAALGSAVEALTLNSTDDPIDDDFIPLPSMPAGPKTEQLDKGFFGNKSAGGHTRNPFNYQYTEQGKKELSGRKAKAVIAIENGVDPKDVAAATKKHFKGNPKGGRTKRRIMNNVNDD